MAVSRALAASRLVGERFHRPITELELARAMEVAQRLKAVRSPFDENRLRREFKHFSSLGAAASRSDGSSEPLIAHPPKDATSGTRSGSSGTPAFRA